MVNNHTLGERCVPTVRRADIEGSKSRVAMNAWRPRASYPCGNFSVTSRRRSFGRGGSIGPGFPGPTRTEGADQGGFCPFALPEVSGLGEPPLGHLRYPLTDVPPQTNSPPAVVPGSGRPLGRSAREARPAGGALVRERRATRPEPRRPRPAQPGESGNRESSGISPAGTRRSPPTYATPRHVSRQRQTRVKLNRVFFPR